MDQEAREALQLLREIKSVAFATVNNNRPAVRIADVMLVDDSGIYFTTARGKHYYKQLVENPVIAIAGMDRNYVSVRVAGDIRKCEGRAVVDRIFEQNTIMEKIYPGNTRNILEAFHLYKGRGEVFDLSSEPPARKRFAFGSDDLIDCGYVITARCSACGLCLNACPVGAVTEGDVYRIDSGSCLECGRCSEACPEDAIEISKGI